ncbi:MAG: ABC transporter ATP-binding protein [Gemmatimonadetes bacterium]|nr:ABC transporter ATP-binding protein [Gemmatimonadota bacterium]
MTPLLSVEALRVDVARGAGVRILEDVSFSLSSGEAVGVLGASGSGKTTLALAMLGLLPPTLVARGSVHFEGHEVLSASRGARRAVRGRRCSIVFQEPLTALNPRMRVVDQVAEVALAHGERDGRRARDAAVQMMERVGLANAAAQAARLPHELSGGERQRVLLAMALLLEPALLIADEPTSALDVTVQAQVLQVLRAQQRERGMSLLMVSHDLGVLAVLCSRVLVLHEGRLVEDAPTRQLLETPAHPFTRAIVAAVRRMERPA